LKVLREKPAITNLTKPLVGLSNEDWNLTLYALAECGIISIPENASSAPQFVDMHPILREYFGQKLRQRNRGAWIAGHKRLYEYLTESTPDKPEPTLDDLQPLYQAVYHGCQAGLYQKVCEDIYAGRIVRGTEFYSIRILGANSADLGAIACFFDKPWIHLSPNLDVV
jgi:hypothetical protein